MIVIDSPAAVQRWDEEHPPIIVSGTPVAPVAAAMQGLYKEPLAVTILVLGWENEPLMIILDSAVAGLRWYEEPSPIIIRSTPVAPVAAVVRRWK